MQTHDHDLETIAAFIDGERVDPHALKRALADDRGRDYLVELVAMRELVATPAMATETPASTRPTRAWWIVSAAAVLLAVAGGFAIGETNAMRAKLSMSNRAPVPTVVVTDNVGWRESRGGN